MVMDLQVTLIDKWRDFPSLEAGWKSIVAQSENHTIFQMWEWAESWVNIFSHSVQPFVVVVRDGRDNVVAIAPLYLSNIYLFCVLPYRTLRFISDYSSGYEYPKIIYKKGYERTAGDAIFRLLSQRSALWDCFWIPNMAGWNNDYERIAEPCRAAGLGHRVREQAFSVIKLPDNYDGFWEMLSKNQRYQIKRQSKKILCRNNVAISQCESRQHLNEYLDALFDLNHKRWLKKGKAGTFNRKPGERCFYQKFTHKALEKGWLQLYGLSEEGRFKAVQIGYVYNDVFYQMQEGFDPEYLPGAGNVLREHIIKSCIGRHVKEYDFLGGMSEHKRRWRGKVRKGHQVIITNDKLKNRLINSGNLWPSGRFILVKPIKRNSIEKP